MCVLHWIETAGYAQNGCYILLLHRHSGLKTGMATRQVECSNQFAHTQQFLSNAKRTLILSRHSSLDIARHAMSTSVYLSKLSLNTDLSVLWVTYDFRRKKLWARKVMRCAAQRRARTRDESFGNKYSSSKVEVDYISWHLARSGGMELAMIHPSPYRAKTIQWAGISGGGCL